MTVKKANSLDGKTWLRYSVSVWSDIHKGSSEKKLNHPAMFPVELPERIIEMFLTEEKTEVLDPFMGSGSTLVAAARTGKHGIGFEISENYIKIAKERIREQSSLFQEKIEPSIYHDDARNMDRYLQPETVDLCITSPPYWDILTRKRTADYKTIRNYSGGNGNLGEITEYGLFLKELKNVFEKVYTVLKCGSYCVVVVMDVRKKGVFYPLHMDITGFMREIGFVLDDIIIWDRRKEYNNLRPLGYPYVFRVNRIHEFVLIFMKP